MTAGDQRGTAAIELPLLLGLVLIPLGLLVLTIPTWIERQQAAREAAAEAARVVVTGDGVDPAGDVRRVVDAVAAAHGLAPGSLHLELAAGGRGEAVTARVTVAIPAAHLPGFGHLPAVSWTASHSERAPDLGEVRR